MLAHSSLFKVLVSSRITLNTSDNAVSSDSSAVSDRVPPAIPQPFKPFFLASSFIVLRMSLVNCLFNSGLPAIASTDSRTAFIPSLEAILPFKFCIKPEVAFPPKAGPKAASAPIPKRFRTPVAIRADKPLLTPEIVAALCASSRFP